MKGVRLLVGALLILLWAPDIAVQTADAAAKESSQLPHTTNTADPDVCSSLTGPFCAYTDSMAFYASYMTPISVLDLQQEGNDASRRSMKTDEGAVEGQRKKCFFQHFASSWMDSGGDVNDLMNQQVANVDECEQLCCEHTECQSFTFWRGRTCFLRAKIKTPRHDGESFSGIRLN